MRARVNWNLVEYYMGLPCCAGLVDPNEVFDPEYNEETPPTPVETPPIVIS